MMGRANLTDTSKSACTTRDVMQAKSMAVTPVEFHFLKAWTGREYGAIYTA